MEIEISTRKTVNITHIYIQLPVRYEEEDMPNDFPLREGDTWSAKIEIDTGKIQDWPKGKSGKFYMKVCDGGFYVLFDAKGKQVASIEENYVPHGIIPGEFGDYVGLEINKKGIITNWPKNPDLNEFFGENEEE